MLMRFPFPEPAVEFAPRCCQASFRQPPRILADKETRDDVFRPARAHQDPGPEPDGPVLYRQFRRDDEEGGPRPRLPARPARPAAQRDDADSDAGPRAE